MERLSVSLIIVIKIIITFSTVIFDNYPVKYTDTTDTFNDIIKLVTDPKLQIPTFRILSHNGDVSWICCLLFEKFHSGGSCN